MKILSKSRWLLVLFVLFFIVGCFGASVKYHDSATALLGAESKISDSKNSALLQTVKFNSEMRIACEPTDELKELFELHNKARRKKTRCDGRRTRKAKALKYSCLLANASWQHANDMSENSYLAHDNRKGLSIGERATKSGYVWRRVGENIARGFSSAQMANKAWLASKGHCENIMNSSYTEMGAAIVGEHWVVMFGSR
jgi:uncharacterized protein YkwD